MVVNMSYLPIEQMQQLYYNLTNEQQCAIIEIIRAMARDPQNRGPFSLYIEAEKTIAPFVDKYFKSDIKNHNMVMRKYNDLRYGTAYFKK